MNDYPPFGPTAPVATLPSAERKRTGHVFADCPARDLEPARKGPKVVGCGPCLARWTEHSAEAGRQQRAFDAAWYASNAATPAVAAAQANEDDMWEAAVPRRTEAVAPTANGGLAQRTGQAHRPNKFGGKCGACNEWVEAGKGWLTGKPGSWGVAHADFDNGGCGEPKAAPPEQAKALTAGVYRQPGGRVIRIQISKSTRKPYSVDALTGEYLKGASQQGLVRLSLEEAKAFGRETGTCCVCSAHLEDPKSVAAGIGPICAGRW